MIAFLLFILAIITANDSLHAGKIHPETTKPYDHTWIDEQTWKTAAPHIIPDEHPAKRTLDKIFEKSRAIASEEAMLKAGFQILPMIDKRKIVAMHPALSGYLVKTYLDCHHLARSDWKIWLHRVVGAKSVQACLDRHDFNDIMKVPQKWLYPLPAKPKPDLDPGLRREFMLVVEDMHPLKEIKNKQKYKRITREQLDALYTVLKENLLHDSIYIHNIPFCKDGKIAFLDLEHHNSTSRRVRYERLTKNFSKELQGYWEQLINQGGP